jgi:hypothetical protein
VIYAARPAGQPYRGVAVMVWSLVLPPDDVPGRELELMAQVGWFESGEIRTAIRSRRAPRYLLPPPTWATAPNDEERAELMMRWVVDVLFPELGTRPETTPLTPLPLRP